MPASSAFAPNSFFFTDPAALSQSAGQAFGPVSTDVYRLTSKFTISADDTDAVAVCTGVVLVQPQNGNANLVNLILRPFKQPISGFNIKYFIYRGLKLSDFFDSNIVISPDSRTSDFINKINASFTAYYASINTIAPPFLAKYIGFDQPNQPDSMMIADLFFKTTQFTDGTQQTETAQTAFELPLIAAGATLGSFPAGEGGFDIVLDYGDYVLPVPNDQFTFNLAYARAAESKIDISAVSDAFQKKLFKEQIFQFLDAAAYYGFHYANGTVSVNASGTTVKYTTYGIYTSVIQNFNTKNTFFLYIQSDRTRSYNFYENYQISDTDQNCLKSGYAANALTESGYGTNGWPVIIINTPQVVTGANITLFLQFVTDNNDNKVLYGQVANILNAQGNNFSGPDDLQLPPDENGNLVDFTKIMQLSNPGTGADGSKSYVATFNILIYQGAVYNYVSGQITDGSGNTTNVTAQPAYFDDIFDELSATPLLKSSDSSTYVSVTSQRPKLINYLYNNVQYGVSAVQSEIINDVITTGDPGLPTLNRAIYVATAIDVFNNVVSVNGTINSNTQTNPAISGSVTGNQIFQLPSSAYYNVTPFTDNGDLINGVNVNSTDSTVPSLIILGITRDENNLLLALNSSSALTNVRIFLIPLFQGGNQLVSTENILYQKFNVGIVGEDSTGVLQLKLTDTSVIIYSLDNMFYYSKAFSDYIQPDSTVSSLVLDLDISL